MKKLVTELILVWDKKISSLTQTLCIESLYCHYEVLNILDKNDINHSDFKELIVRIHSLYLKDVLQVARNHDYNFIEFYTALAAIFHFRSKMLLFHKACSDDLMHACSFLMCMDKNDEMDMNDSIKLFIDTTEKSFRKCKDYINKRININESLNYKDLIKEKDFQKFDCFIMHNLWEENKMGEMKTYYDLMYTLKKNLDNDDFKTDIYNYSINIDIPYKFVMEYIEINCQLDQLGLVRQKSLFVDYNIIQRQAVSLIAMQLMDEKKAKDSYDLFSNYIRILDDEEVNLNSERIKNEIENKKKLLLELYSVDQDTLDIICFLFKNSNDVEIKKWKDDCINQLDNTMNTQLFFMKRLAEEE